MCYSKTDDVTKLEQESTSIEDKLTGIKSRLKGKLTTSSKALKQKLQQSSSDFMQSASVASGVLKSKAGLVKDSLNLVFTETKQNLPQSAEAKVSTNVKKEYSQEATKPVVPPRTSATYGAEDNKNDRKSSKESKGSKGYRSPKVEPELDFPKAHRRSSLACVPACAIHCTRPE